MIKLKVIQKGIFLEIPGISPIRTPAEVDISNVDINLVLSYLRKNGINRYQIIAEDERTKKQEVVKDFDIKNKSKSTTNIDDKINNLELLMMKVIDLQNSYTNKNSEQITDKIDKLEEKLTKKITDIKKQQPLQKVEHKKEELKKPEIEELDLSFIPEIDLSTMEVKGTSTQNVIYQGDEDLEDKADLLSRLINN